MSESEQFLIESMGDVPRGSVPMGWVPTNVTETLKDENPEINLDDYFAIPTTDIDSIISPIFTRQEKNGTDSLVDPFIRTTASFRSRSMTEDTQKITDLLSVQEQLLPGDWWRSSFMRGGAHPCWITPRNAFRQSWKFVLDRESYQPITDNDLLTKLKKVTRDFKIKEIIVSAAQVSAVFGRALAYKFKAGNFGELARDQWRVIPIEEEYITYTEKNTILEYNPVIRLRKGSDTIKILPKDSVLFINQKDPMGNGFSGIPAHAMAYKTIIRMEITTKSYVNLIHNRGMGVFLVGITAGTPNKTELQKYAKMIGNPGSRAIVFYPKNIMEVEVKEGMKMGFNYMGTDERFTRHLSMTTGIPGLRMEGEKTGAVTGSEVDQDNTAENYQVLHEYHHDSIVQLYKKSDDTLESEEFCLHFPMDVKLDRMKETQIFATEAAAVTTVEDAVTFDEVRDRLGYPPWENAEEGAKIYSVYVNDLRNEHQIGFNEDIEMEDFASQGGGNKTPGEKRGGNRETSRGTAKAKERDSVIDELSQKEYDAFRLMEHTDFGRRRVNDALKAFYKEGIGTPRLQWLRKQIDRLEKIKDGS